MSRGATAVSAALLARVDRLRSGRTPFVLATVVRAERPTSARPGDRAVVLPDGTVEGFVGGACAESTVRLEGLRLLRAGESTLLRITPSASSTSPAAGGDDAAVEGLVTVDNPCLSGGTLEIFLEAVVPPTVVIVHGTGPIARALGRLGTALDYEVRPADPAAPIPSDAAAVVVASHGHGEPQLLTAALAAGVPYVALVASRRRGAAVLAGLESPHRDRVHTPAGLDLGARTPAEVALAVYAELVAGREHDVSAAALADAARDRAGHDGGGSVEVAATVDPVCGMEVAVTAAGPSVVVDGVTHRFCGAGCRQAFLDRVAG